ncbi:hypothetical protein HU200_032222 [Digitaria exilis]|uniref:Uncharacterized protein n=1 Tax=Digitaria exilis TaxID=1010633 RepID=A0A835ELU0_9POAL|nr:hypothetical protein HU200_032222 [Digitaria exilis]
MPIQSSLLDFLGVEWDTSIGHELTVLHAREKFGADFFREVIILAMWALWIHMNSIVFDGASLSIAAWRRSFMEEIKALTLRLRRC